MSELESQFLTASRAALIAEEQAQAQARRRARRTPVYSFMGGALGFALTFLLLTSPAAENQDLLLVLTVLRLVAGGLAGFFLVFLVDLAAASEGRLGWMAWLGGGMAGSGVFALLLYFDTLLRVSAADTGLLYAALAGMVWGFPAGLGRVWMLKDGRSPWQTMLIIASLCGLLLVLANQVYPVLSEAPAFLVLLSGAAVPLAMFVSAHLADPEGEE